MDANTENLRKLIDRLNIISLWERIFRWRQVKNLLYDALTEVNRFCFGIDNYKEQLLKAEVKSSDLAKDLLYANEALFKKGSEADELRHTQRLKEERIRDLEVESSSMKSTARAHEGKIFTLEKEKAELGSQIRYLTDELNRMKDLNTKLLKDDEFRRTEHSNSLATLTRFQNQVHQERQREVEERSKAEQLRIMRLKETWSTHQDNVRNCIKTICSKHTIEYVEKVPFKGEPDNTLKICEEYIVFDAKSPAGEELLNFPVYLKDQAEKAKKYCKEEDVKKEVFFVVPTNTLSVVRHFVYRLADYTVYIVSLDSLEPLILSLQKLEEYEFAEQLSPEERENICRVLGKFAHLTKRRIQIDTFFIKQFMELAYKCESDLPAEILDKVVEFEKAEKLNPPTERRSKQINLKELEKDAIKLRNETSTKGIATIESIISSELNKMPLYNEENAESVI